MGEGPHPASRLGHRPGWRSRRARPRTAPGAGRAAAVLRGVPRRRFSALPAHVPPAEPRRRAGRGQAHACRSLTRCSSGPERRRDRVSTGQRRRAPVAGRGRSRRCPGPVCSRVARGLWGPPDGSAPPGRRLLRTPPCGPRGRAGPRPCRPACRQRLGRPGPDARTSHTPAPGGSGGSQGVRSAAPGPGWCRPLGSSAGARTAGRRALGPCGRAPARARCGGGRRRRCA